MCRDIFTNTGLHIVTILKLITLLEQGYLVPAYSMGGILVITYGLYNKQTNKQIKKYR